MQKNATKSTRGPEGMVGFWINRASRVIARVMDVRLRPFGFGMSQLPVLGALSQGGALSQTELARLARVEQPTMAEMLARMERDGVVERAPNPDDKRGTLISLTRRSRALAPKAALVLRKGERDATAGFTDAEKALLRELLQRFVKNLESDLSDARP